jgi:hypothetical protein
VKFAVSDVDTQKKGGAYRSQLTLLAKPEADPRRGGGTTGRQKNGNRDRQGTQPSATVAMPELKWKMFDDRKVSLQIRHDDQGKPEYFANQNNEYLAAELIRAKEEDRPLVKFWFGYGLLLCALGMLKAQEERAAAETQSRKGAPPEESETEGDDLKRVSAYCEGIARVIIPIIRTLYRGPQAVGA